MNTTATTKDANKMNISIDNIAKINGIAGQYAYTVTLTYTYDDPEVAPQTMTQTFIGTSYGNPGPVLMTFDTGGQTYVIEPARFGDTLNPSWIRNFYA